ncbi:hypothetical protein [Rhodanobacter spathiphylli]|uniref:Uncharacterized protein n=1 Tax=Rhodanobacter spathiphylli B39 TaxID=1163407 RepID=I4W491_9GAMM|nr:hypothetical protein [Rhodanobacter spathiphylli]EIL94282.1 hypothetical protein UU7_04762 [Rhodanobacter spathiphylli B39]
MFDVVDFMEKMGGDAQLSQASDSELAEALAATDIASELQSVVLAKNAQHLEALLVAKPVCVLLSPPGPPGSPLHAPLPPPPPLLPEEEWEQYQRER